MDILSGEEQYERSESFLQKICTLFAAVVLTLQLATPTFATTIYEFNKDIPEGFFADSIMLYPMYDKMLVNGEVKQGEKPVMVNGTTMLPLRAIGEAMGAKVNWDSQQKQAHLTMDTKNIVFTLGEKQMSVNCAKVPIPQQPFLEQGRVYLPLRAIGEALGKQVEYDSNGIVGEPLISIHNFEMSYTEDAWEYDHMFALKGLVKLLLTSATPYYGDNVIAVYSKADGQTYVQYWSTLDRDEFLLSDESYIFQSNGKNYLMVSGHEGPGNPVFVYHYEGTQFTYIAQIASNMTSYKVHGDNIYVLDGSLSAERTGHYTPSAEQSNLTKISLIDGTITELGKPGFIYGINPSPKNDVGIEYLSWEVRDDGVYISGFDNFSTEVIVNQLYGDIYYDVYASDMDPFINQYKVDLNGNGQMELN